MIANGLIGVNNGTIRDLVIESGEINGGAYIGSIAGKNYGSIINCGNKVDVTGNKSCVGGICGSCLSGSISGCFNTGHVVVDGSSYVETVVGGIVGNMNHGCAISDCYNLGNISGTNRFAGGIIGVFSWGGNMTTTVKRCFTSGSVSSGDFCR